MNTVYGGIVIATRHEATVPGCKERFSTLGASENSQPAREEILRECGIDESNYGPWNEFEHVDLYKRDGRVFVIEIDRAPPAIAAIWEPRTARIHEWPGNAKAPPGAFCRTLDWVTSLCSRAEVNRCHR